MSMFDANVHQRATALVSTATNDDEFARQLRIRLHVMRAYRELGELTRRTGIRAVNGVFQVSDLSGIASTDPPSKEHRQSSFVVDYEEATIAPAALELEQSSQGVTPAAVAAFVDRYIEHKTYARGFDIASRVATTRSGDCTEHAVLTAALLRRFEIPARLVFGLVFVGLSSPDREAHILVAGHAWVEHYDGRRWQIVDAALNPQGGPSTRERIGVPGLPEGARLRLAYLPVTVMHDETASFSRGLMDEAGIDAIVRLEVDVATR